MTELIKIHQPGTPATAEALPPLSVIVEHFLFTQDVRPQSRNLYRRTLKQFFEWVNASGHNLNQLTKEHPIAYKQYLIEKGLSPFTVGSYITVLRLFYKFTSIEGIYKNIADGVKPPKMPEWHMKQTLNQSQGKALLQRLSSQGPRNKAIGSLLIYCGFRTIEVSRLKIKDLVLMDGIYIIKVHGKGRHTTDEEAAPPDEAVKAIKEYLATRPGALPGEPMFISESNNSKGKPLSTRMISGIIKEALRVCGMDDLTLSAHSLRHTYATSLLAKGEPIEDIQEELRHKSINTTMKYVKTEARKKKRERRTSQVIDKMYN